MKQQILTILLLSMSLLGTAQVQTDTITLAKQLREQGHLRRSSALLQAHSHRYPKDINAIWLYAQNEYWRGHFTRAKKAYKAAVKLQPNKDYLLIDYARSLTEMGDLKPAEKQLDHLSQPARSYSDALYLRARIAYARGEYAKAWDDAERAHNNNTSNMAAVELLNEIGIATSHWGRITAGLSVDDQPVTAISPQLEAGLYLHRYATLNIGLTAPVYLRGSNVANAQIVTLGATAPFKKIGMQLRADIGIARQPYQGIMDWTGDITVHQTLLKYLNIDLLAEHKPYLNTYSSLDTQIAVTNMVGSVGWDDAHFIMGRAAFDMNYFADGNYTYAAYGYVYAPPIKASIMTLRFGYGYSYSDSRDNRYTARLSVDSIISLYKVKTTIDGVYNPYFTPAQQHIHSALVSLLLRPTKHIDVGVNANVGFYAYAQNPYLYLDKNAAAEHIVSRGYYTQSFIPYTLSTFAEWRLSPLYTLRAQYEYKKAFFYTVHTASVSFKMTIPNARR